MQGTKKKAKMTDTKGINSTWMAITPREWMQLLRDRDKRWPRTLIRLRIQRSKQEESPRNKKEPATDGEGTENFLKVPLILEQSESAQWNGMQSGAVMCN